MSMNNVIDSSGVNLNVSMEVNDQTLANKSSQKTINEYSQIHTGPYTVIVQGIQGNIGNLHPMKIGKILYENGNYKIINIE